MNKRWLILTLILVAAGSWASGYFAGRYVENLPYFDHLTVRNWTRHSVWLAYEQCDNCVEIQPKGTWYTEDEYKIFERSSGDAHKLTVDVDKITPLPPSAGPATAQGPGSVANSGTIGTLSSSDGYLRPATVASLSACDGALLGMMAKVIDASRPRQGYKVQPGGTSKAVVVCNGSEWFVADIIP